jgi:nitrite reductase/ring-hydroxylating ferredoxin subunit
MPEFVRAAALKDIPQGRGKLLQIRGRAIALFNVGGNVYAVKDSCPHRGFSLHRGKLEDGVVTCPGHSWQFDLRTGASVNQPEVGIRCYRVEIRGDSVWVEVP